eukprot:CAMPEP_0184867806 /NCGR_PEP_ID=MMETSP0580-20130426/27803_1 /TAXON_ID=1118495 /ORGANISM="Dactyliosolen fragilissimus" /LENGTH=67 /DNA_ID=CAMNT_0027368267 /DNA_START=42 /DNA_END=245 /DNA_ORIENTATION=+
MNFTLIYNIQSSEETPSNTINANNRCVKLDTASTSTDKAKNVPKPHAEIFVKGYIEKLHPSIEPIFK